MRLRHNLGNTMRVIGDDLGAQIKAEMEAESAPTPAAAAAPAQSATPPAATKPTATASSHDGAKSADSPAGNDNEMDGQPDVDEALETDQAAKDAQADETVKFDDADPALDEVLEFGEHKATIRELFDALANRAKYQPEHFEGLVNGLEEERANLQTTAAALGSLAEVRTHPARFYLTAMQQDEDAGRMPPGSTQAMRAWLIESAQQGVIDPAKWDQDAMAEQHSRALAQREAEFTRKLTQTEAQADMSIIQARYGHMSPKDTMTLKAAITERVASGRDRDHTGQPIDRLVLRTFEELRKAGKIAATSMTRAQPSPRRVADRIRRIATDRRAVTNNTPAQPMTDAELEAAANRQLLGV